MVMTGQASKAGPQWNWIYNPVGKILVDRLIHSTIAVMSLSSRSSGISICGKLTTSPMERFSGASDPVQSVYADWMLASRGRFWPSSEHASTWLRLCK